MIRNICIYGAGALGGFVAAKLASAAREGTSISVIARGSHLEAIREDGITLHEAGSQTPLQIKVTATDDPTQLPKQDLVITGLKGHQLPGAADGIAHLLHERTRVVMILNGIPWWYFHREYQTGHAELQFDQLDPRGVLWRQIGPERVIGCVAHQGGEVISPGTIRTSNRGFMILGEPSNENTEELQEIAALLQTADIDARVSTRIRDDIWNKLMGNTAFNPVSALTRALMNDIMSDALLSNLIARIMKEVMDVGEALGATFERTVEQRLEQSRDIGPVRTSMLQDLLAGKPLELAPLVGMVVSLGRLAGVATPATETVLSLVSQLDRENRREREA